MAGYYTPGFPAPTAATLSLPVPQGGQIPVDTEFTSGQYPQTIRSSVQQLLASAHGQEVNGNSVVTYSATVTFDASKSSYVKMVFGAGNCTMTFTNLVAGQYIILDLTQDSGGSRTLTPAVSGGTLLTSGTPLSTTASARDLAVVYTPNGTTLFYFPLAKAFA